MQKKTRQFLSFIINHHLFALEIGNIVEILLPPNLRKFDSDLPDACENIIYRGKKIPVLSLIKQLIKNPGRSSLDYRIIIIGRDNNFICLRVDSAEEILYVDEKNIQPPGSITSELNSEFLEGKIILEEQTIYILSLKRILELITVDQS
jgi:chemotaxis signal transduction protein